MPETAVTVPGGPAGVGGSDPSVGTAATPFDQGTLTQLEVSPGSISFSSATLQAELLLRTTGGGAAAYSVSSDQPWLSVTPNEGEVAGTGVVIRVAVIETSLSPGEHVAELLVEDSAAGTRIVPVTYSVLAADDPTRPITQISGRIEREGAGLAGVLVSADNGGPTAVTDSTGNFELSVPEQWSGTVTPADINYVFSPQSLTFAQLGDNAAGNLFIASRLAPSVPMIGVRRASDSRLLRYQGEQPLGTVDSSFEYTVTFDDANLTADLRWLGDDRWEVTITPKVAVTEVWFPYEMQEYVLGGDGSDDAFFTARVFGDLWKSDALNGSFHGPIYPGDAFAPLVVLADASSAKMLAATNWPPRAMQPMNARGRMAILYRVDAALGFDEVPAVGESFTYGLLQTQASGNPDAGLYAWQTTLDAYRSWLTTNATAAGLFPIPYPQWLRATHGWMIEALHEFTDNQAASASYAYNWDDWKHIFPWLQIWGQTSDFNPTGGCCDAGPDVHPRYLPVLADFADEVAQQHHIGYYSRTWDGQGTVDGLTADSAARLADLLDWIDTNRANGANATYIDVFGANYFGDALTIANLFLDTFPPGTVIEYAVDVYPAAFYIANSIYGNGTYGAGADYTDCIDCFDDATARVTFPRFGRYLLDDRIIFLGSGNGGVTFWGSDNDHWQERQVFLLGAKIDVHTSLVEDVKFSGVMNRALQYIISERDRVGWWAREPRYRDRAGISNIPSTVDVRRFVDRNGVTLFAIDNWQQRAGTSFTFDGQLITIPVDQLSIIEIP